MARALLSLGIATGSAGMFRGAVTTSVLAFGAQFISLLSQLAFAALFGSSPATDAYFAALALPAFVSTVLVAAVSMVFIPVVIERRSRAGREDADVISNGTINLTTLVLVALAVAGATFSGPILHVSAPGLSPAAHLLAQELARILWPSTVTISLVALLTAMWQIDSKFGWPALVPLMGTAANLVLLVVLAPALGIAGAAVAWTTGAALQAILLLPVIARRWRPRLSLAHPGVREVVFGSWPLILANVPIRASTVWERYLASLLPVGELSHLTYASRALLSISVLFSAGPAAVIFPRLAEDAAAGDLARVGRTTTRGLWSMWLIVAPAAALLIALAEPGVELVFERGAFSHEDSQAVASLFRVYVPSLIPAALSIVAGRALYALRATRVMAAVAVVESVAYLGYTAFLASALGARGIALGFTIYMTVSLGWQLIYLQRITRALSVRSVGRFVLSGMIAVAAGFTAWAVAQIATAPLIAASAGGAAGLVVYVAGLVAARRVPLPPSSARAG